jgi:cyclase
MLKKRIIPCLDIKNGRTVKGVNFLGLRDAGDPIELSHRYIESGADELVYLDITATVNQENIFYDLIKKIAQTVDIPFTVGGGIKTIQDVSKIISSGADKISLNSRALEDPNLISEIAKRFGSQCLVLAVDTKEVQGSWIVYKNGGRVPTRYNAKEWIKIAQDLGAGEILLTSMNNDGTREGFALDIIQEISETINIPLIASGGAGTIWHFIDLFKNTKATGALAASIFHYQDISIKELKRKLLKKGIALR